jgi:DNA (cytosine-5)-methyltransferase 1
VKVYYNEIDVYCAQWLKNLMLDGLIPAGDVDTRSIADVKADDLRDYTQCHFFAGLGGWAHALNLAGWGERPVWTGSCPCQPFSVAGKQKGIEDERHLWPVWYGLIKQCRPSVIFGEQVASAAVWLDRVYSDLEAEGYAVGSAVLPACAVNAPHKRDRLWFVADARGERWLGREVPAGGGQH